MSQYSQKNVQDAKAIRDKYTVKQETKMEKLERLDSLVQNAGKTKALVKGLVGVVIFIIGIGFCTGFLPKHLGWGIVFDFVGIVLALSAWPTYRSAQKKARKQYIPEILKLSEEIEKGL